VPIAVPQGSGRQRLNIHGAIDLETGKTRMIEAETVNALSIRVLQRTRPYPIEWRREKSEDQGGLQPNSSAFRNPQPVEALLCCFDSNGFFG
jgi:hypothetical protein